MASSPIVRIWSEAYETTRLPDLASNRAAKPLVDTRSGLSLAASTGHQGERGWDELSGRNAGAALICKFQNHLRDGGEVWAQNPWRSKRRYHMIPVIAFDCSPDTSYLVWVWRVVGERLTGNTTTHIGDNGHGHRDQPPLDLKPGKEAG